MRVHIARSQVLCTAPAARPPATCSVQAGARNALASRDRVGRAGRDRAAAMHAMRTGSGRPSRSRARHRCRSPSPFDRSPCQCGHAAPLLHRPGSGHASRQSCCCVVMAGNIPAVPCPAAHAAHARDSCPPAWRPRSSPACAPSPDQLALRRAPLSDHPTHHASRAVRPPPARRTARSVRRDGPSPCALGSRPVHRGGRAGGRSDDDRPSVWCTRAATLRTGSGWWRSAPASDRTPPWGRHPRRNNRADAPRPSPPTG